MTTAEVGTETATLEPAVRTLDRGRGYLFVVEELSTRTVQLPTLGILTIGRMPEADLQIDHVSVSRRHARIVVDRHEIRITDLDSHNGTRVNGDTLSGARVLVTGDVLAIGDVMVVVHANLEREMSHVILDEPSWRRRLVDEVERAVAFERPLAVLAIDGAAGMLEGALRSIDVLGIDHGQLLVLLPEADPEAAATLAAIVLRAVARERPTARVGIATCPTDATDPASLVMAARSAARVAPEGGVAHPRDAVERRTFGERSIVLCHPLMTRIFDLLARLAPATLPVLVIGETGVGKEHAAFALHHGSPRRAAPFVPVNCAALPEALVETQLFGHVRGAFTGAITSHVGVFEAASGGTLFLDEIGELALPVQAKLLRALETHRITRVGETEERTVDVRIVAATNRVLEDEVAAGRFRQDLYFRLGSARVHLPPLRERRCEIPILFAEFLALAAARTGRPAPKPTPYVVQRLLAYHWPGNVRELKHVAELCVATVEDDRIEPDDLPPELGKVRPRMPAPTPSSPGVPQRLADEIAALERFRMVEALAKTSGIKTRAAALLGMPIRTFNLKFRQYQL